MNKEMKEMKEISIEGDSIVVDIWYPRSESSKIKSVQVGIVDVRAADNLLVAYDFERDGWSIKQAQFFEGDDPGWIEVAFVHAWGSQKD